jgi:hypothetical protein
MTRSELLKKLLSDVSMIKLGLQAYDPIVPLIEPQRYEEYDLLESILLAEQKRAAGCAYCNGNMLDGYALENMYGESQRIINLAMKNHRSGDQLPISFCPNCGRSLTDGESE